MKKLHEKSIFVTFTISLSSDSLDIYSLSFIFKLIFSGDIQLINALRPAIVTFLACLSLKEPCGLFEVVNLIISLIGMIFIMQPPFLFPQEEMEQMNSHFWVSLLFFGGVCSVSVTAVITRALKVIP